MDFDESDDEWPSDMPDLKSRLCDGDISSDEEDVTVLSPSLGSANFLPNTEQINAAVRNVVGSSVNEGKTIKNISSPRISAPMLFESEGIINKNISAAGISAADFLPGDELINQNTSLSGRSAVDLSVAGYQIQKNISVAGIGKGS